MPRKKVSSDVKNTRDDPNLLTYPFHHRKGLLLKRWVDGSFVIQHNSPLLWVAYDPPYGEWGVHLCSWDPTNANLDDTNALEILVLTGVGLEQILREGRTLKNGMQHIVLRKDNDR